MVELSPFLGTNFVARESPYGFGIRFFIDREDNSIYATTVFDRHKEGGPGILHGGAVAAVLDEAMGAACFAQDHPGFTVTMTYDYKTHIPLNIEIKLRAWVEKIEGRKAFATCEAVLPDGTVAVTGSGIFVRSDRLREMIESAGRTLK